MTVVLIDHRYRGVFIDNCHMLNNATADRDLGVATSIRSEEHTSELQSRP